jgi:hypothetical protein
MNQSFHSRRRPLAAALGLWGAILAASAAAAEPHDPAAIRDLTAATAREVVRQQKEKTSVHAERGELDAALRAAGVPADVLERLWADVDAAVLPGAGTRLDGFLFLTRNPEWLALRGRFAEFLDLPLVETLRPDAVRELRAYDGLLSLPGVRTLSRESLAALDGFGGEDWGAALELPGLADLPPDTAAALARTKGLLVLPALQSLSPEAATSLAAHEGIGVVIGGLQTLPPETAAALAGLKSLQGMLLPDLKVLDSVPLAGRLAKQDHVFLPKVRSLTPAIAAALAPSVGGELSLPGLVDLPVDVAETLAASGYFGITLGNATTLTPESATALAKHRGPLIFPGRRPPTVETAAALAAHVSEIRLPGLAELPAEVALALAPHTSLLVCEGLNSLPPATAAALARHRGGLWLGGLKTIGPEEAAVLAKAPGSLALPHLAAASPKAIAALLTKEGVELPPLEAIEIVPEPDGSRDDFVAPEPR